MSTKRRTPSELKPLHFHSISNERLIIQLSVGLYDHGTFILEGGTYGSQVLLARDGRSRRLCPGEGSVSIKNVLEHIANKDVDYGLEIPNEERLQVLGFEKYITDILNRTKEYLGEYA